jgi:transposase
VFPFLGIGEHRCDGPDGWEEIRPESYRRIRGWLRSRGIGIVIPTRTNQRRVQAFDREAYRDRNVVERCVGWLKEARRVGTRYEKLARNFLAMVRIAIIRRLLRVIHQESLG